MTTGTTERTDAQEEERRREREGFPLTQIPDPEGRDRSSSRESRQRPGPACSKGGGSGSGHGSRSNSGGGSRNGSRDRSARDVRSRPDSAASDSSVRSTRSATAAARHEAERKLRREKDLLTKRFNEEALHDSDAEMNYQSDGEAWDNPTIERDVEFVEVVDSDVEETDAKTTKALGSKRPRLESPPSDLSREKRDNRGRPPTSGEYRNLAQQKKEYNAQRQKEQELELLDRLKTLSGGELYSCLKIDFDDAVENITHNPTGDIANRARESLEEIMRVARVSKNLNGPCVKSLKQAAVLSAAVVEVLRTRADSADGSDTRKRIRFLEKELVRSQQESKAEIDKLRGELNEAKQLIAEMKGKTRASRPGRNRIVDSPSPEPEHYLMGNEEESIPIEEESCPVVSQIPEVDMEECSGAGRDVESRGARDDKPLKPKKGNKKIEITPQDFVNYPAIRPAIQGKARILEDRILTGHTVKMVDNSVKSVVDEDKTPQTKQPVVNVQNILTQLTPKLEQWLKGSLQDMGIETGPKIPAITSQVEGANDASLGSQTQGNKKKKKTKVPDTKGTPALPGNSCGPAPSRSGPSVGPKPTADTAWTEVLGRGAKKKRAALSTTKSTGPSGQGGTQSPHAQKPAKTPTSGKGATSGQRRKPPRRAAIVLACPPEGYTEAMKIATSKIDLEQEFGIQALRPKKSASGSLVLEIPGPNGAQKAADLKTRLEEVLQEVEGVRISRPIKMTDLRIRDIVEPVDLEAIRQAICRDGSCQGEEVKVGSPRRAPNGLCSIWARCPLTAANKIVPQKKIRIGWLSARVEALPERQLQCYRCLERGHTQNQCNNEHDRHDMCYRCGQPGHNANSCEAPPHCPICEAAGKPAAHRMGGSACKMPKGNRRGRGSKDAPAHASGVSSGPAVRSKEGRDSEQMEVDPAPQIHSERTTPMMREDGTEEPRDSGRVQSSAPA